MKKLNADSVLEAARMGGGLSDVAARLAVPLDYLLLKLATNPTLAEAVRSARSAHQPESAT
jgi:hypothetical protein